MTAGVVVSGTDNNHILGTVHWFTSSCALVYSDIQEVGGLH